MSVITVEHPGARYDVVVGNLGGALDRIAALADGRLLPLVSDARVFGLYGQRFEGLAHPRAILLPQGEAAKDWDGLALVTHGLAAMEVTRGTPVIALGGGSIGDVTGLAAALFKRGCPVIHVPTTLLAQADSAVGGKNAIDSSGQKNLVGIFHHPALVIADPDLLDTLDQRQLRAGYAEIVKYGLIDDPEFFLWCQANGAAIIAGQRSARLRAVEHCVRAKARFVSADPADLTGKRALLNLGHSFGHAIESVAGLGKVLHGEAVAIGTVLAFRFSVTLGLCPPDDARTVRNHLAELGLPTTLGDIGLRASGSRLFEAMKADKKAGRGGLALVLVRGIGIAVLVPAALPALAAFLREAD